MAKYRVTSPDGVTFEVTAPDDATPEQVQAYAQENMPKAAPAKPAAQSGMQTIANIGGGMLRGAGSIGATLLTPYDMLAGNTKSIGNPERRAAMTGGLKELGVDTDSLGFNVGKLGTEIAGTMGAGGGLANVITRAAPGLAAKAAPVVDAIRTSGMSSAGLTGRAGLAARSAGGAITGGAAAGLVSPEGAATGAGISAALPGGLQVAGRVGQAVGNTIRGPAQTPELAAAVGQARQAGYVIPPTQAKPTLGNRIMEGFAGKITTAQNASAKNQAVTDDLAAKALGLPAGTKATPQVLEQVRAAAGQAYGAVKSTGTVSAGQPYEAAIDAIVAPLKKAAAGFPKAKANPLIDEIESLKSPAFDADAAVEKVKELRDLATSAYGKQDKAAGKAYKAAAVAIEDALERHLQSIGASPQVLQDFREARQLIAKTYSVGGAANAATGAVDARKLAGQLQRGKPLSGELRTAAEFAARFPKASQTVEGMGSLPQTSPLDWIPAGALSAGLGNPLMMLGVGARPMARAATLSPMVQNRLIQQPGRALNALQNPALQQFILRGAPVAGTSGGQ